MTTDLKQPNIVRKIISSNTPMKSSIRMNKGSKRENFLQNINQLEREEKDGKGFLKLRIVTQEENKNSALPSLQHSGSLVEIFDFYTNVFSAKKKLSGKYKELSFALQEKAKTALCFGELLGMMKDFDVVPKLLHRGQLMTFFSQRKLDPNVMDKDAIYVHLMDFNQFLNLIIQVGLYVYPLSLNRAKLLPQKKVKKLGFDSNFSIQQHEEIIKLDAFISYIFLDDIKIVKEILNTIGCQRKASLYYGLPPSQHIKVETLEKGELMIGNNLISKKVAPPFLVQRLDAYCTKSKKSGNWKAFNGPYIDCGKMMIKTQKKYRINVCCVCPSTLLSIDVKIHDLHGVEVNYKATRVTTGLDLRINVVINALTAGEMHGFIRILAMANGVNDIIKEYEIIDVPVYCYILEEHSISFGGGKVSFKETSKNLFNNNENSYNNPSHMIPFKIFSRPSSAPSKRISSFHASDGFLQRKIEY